MDRLYHRPILILDEYLTIFYALYSFPFDVSLTLCMGILSIMRTVSRQLTGSFSAIFQFHLYRSVKSETLSSVSAFTIYSASTEPRERCCHPVFAAFGQSSINNRCRR